MDKNEIFRMIADCACEVIPELENHAFQFNDRLQDLGANSIDRAEIVLLVMEKLSLKIPRVELFGPSNMGELAELLHAKLHAA